MPPPLSLPSDNQEIYKLRFVRSVCIHYVITAEKIGPIFFVVPHMTPGYISGRPKIEKHNRSRAERHWQIMYKVKIVLMPIYRRQGYWYWIFTIEIQIFRQKFIYFWLKILRSTDLKTILKMIWGEKVRERGGV